MTTPLVRRLGVGLACLACLGGGVWAGHVVTQGASVPTQASLSTFTTTVTEQKVERAFHLNSTVVREKTPLAAGLLSGVISRIYPADTYANGDRVYEVDGRAVSIVVSTVQFYRPLALGVTGDDVRALQQMLVEKGFLTSADGTFGPGTQAAVKRWQASQGQNQTGSVGLGEVVAVDHAPLAIALAKDVRAGQVASPGQPILYAASATPRVVLDLSDLQRAAIPVDAHLTLRSGDRTWDAVMGQNEPSTHQGFTSVTLTAPDGGPVCGADCARFTAADGAVIPTDVQVIAPTSGPAVPTSALIIRPDATTAVTVVGEKGDEVRTVKVRASYAGLAIVDGVRVGEKVRAFATPGGQSPAGGSHKAPSAPGGGGTKAPGGGGTKAPAGSATP